VQIWARQFSTPWYLPLSGTLSLAFLAASVWQARTLWRALALVFVLLLVSGEWAFLLLTRLPSYDGPVRVGLPFPAFATTRADGKPFTQKDLSARQNTVLVFLPRTVVTVLHARAGTARTTA